MVRRYVELAAAEIRAQHERHSPADTLLRRPRPQVRARTLPPAPARNRHPAGRTVLQNR
jgi:hypothetical protein